MRSESVGSRGLEVFSVSSRGYYGLLALYELGRHHGTAPIQARTICDAHGTPQRYVEQLLLILKKAGFVQSYRGREGGYSLALPPSGIKISDVLRILEGELALGHNGKAGALDFFWNRVERGIQDVVSITLEDLVLDKQRQDREVNYSI